MLAASRIPRGKLHRATNVQRRRRLLSLELSKSFLSIVFIFLCIADSWPRTLCTDNFFYFVRSPADNPSTKKGSLILAQKRDRSTSESSILPRPRRQRKEMRAQRCREDGRSIFGEKRERIKVFFVVLLERVVNDICWS